MDAAVINTNNNLIIEFMKIFLISILSFYSSLKIINIKKNKILDIIKIIISIGMICIATLIVRYKSNSASLICLDILLATCFSYFTKNKLGYSTLISTLSLSINYIFYSLAAIICFIIFKIIKIENDYIVMLFIALIYTTLVMLIFKIKRLNKGVSFLVKNKENEYFEIFILNISATIFCCFIMLTNFNIEFMRAALIYLIIFSIIMLVTIQKSLQLYYKQKLLIQDLKETKEELEIKKEEVKQLEQENLNFSKISHSIAHKQKVLEHKLNELILKNEIANEIDIKDRIKNVTKDLQKETVIELKKTGIEQIDDMLSYMQAECSKSKIDFQLQLIGNIHQMINHHISKDDLEILLADHIKDAIIAINHANNINKSILVRIGKIDGDYGVYIYDSGIEFEIETFFNLGKKPSTTHQNDGGTGMGFLNTFDTLRKTKGSIEIYEYNKPCKDNFTKLIKFKFDDKTEFRIYSYRHEEIQKKNTRKELSINPLPL